ncbi:MAG: recombination-associated protein RdgC [Aquabacterium sp.]|nr:recombination-associated protein RdgC [Aquabacterium sp.]
MFKNLMVYRLGADWQPAVAQVEAALDGARFAECGATQPRAMGWVPPRGEGHGVLIEVIDGQWLLQLMVESKLVPGAVIKRQVEALAAQIEKQTGRKPGKKETRELKDQALLDLLPMAFTKRAAIKVWISPATRLLVIDAGSASRADETLTALTQVLPGLSAQLINTTVSPQAAMADWLVSGEPPTPFTIDRDCELKAADGEKPVVRYARHALDLPEIREHIAAGKRPTRLALTWNDRVSFTLTEGLQLKKISFLDGVFEGRKADGDEGFDADAAITTGELAPMIGELIDALGGEQVLGATPAPVPGAAEAPPAPMTTPTIAPTAPKSTTDRPPWEAALP